MHNFQHKIQNVDIICIYISNVYNNTIHFNAYPMLCHGKHAVNACVLTNFQSKVKNYSRQIIICHIVIICIFRLEISKVHV